MRNVVMVNAGNKDFVMETTNTRKTRALAKEFVVRLAKYRGLCDEWVARILADEETMRRVRYDMTFATEEKRTTDNGTEYYRYVGKGFNMSFNAGDYDEYIINI